MVEKQNIAILMAAYNGEKYIREQIDSILSQSNHQWHLYIHDDGSTDSTGTIIDGYAHVFPDLVTVMEYPSQGGALPNFMSMLERVDADFYMFSDQDDVWYETKIEKSVKAMLEQEKLNPGKPVVVHADARVVDGDLNLIHPSFRDYSHINPEKVTCLRECVINVTLGCAMLFNRKSRDVSLDRPWKYALMHDAWVITRTFAAGGIVYAIPESLMDYRNHSNNTIGAVDGNRFTLGYRISHFGQMLRLNIKQYRMLRSAGYGSVFTYYYHKLLLHIH